MTQAGTSGRGARKRISPISADRKAELELRSEVYALVLARDMGYCVICHKRGAGVHEVVPRSHFGKRGKAKCYTLENMAVICTSCHGRVHTAGGRIFLLRLLMERYHYVYSEQPWAGYVGGGYGKEEVKELDQGGH